MKNKLINHIEERQMKLDLPQINIGSKVAVHVRIREGNKERIQIFEGLVIAKNGTGTTQSIRVRKISYGIGVERVFLIHSPVVAEVNILRNNKVRRAKLYYMRNLKGKAARLKEVSKTS